MADVNKIISLANQNEMNVINIRRTIHEKPELSFKEEKTAFLVASELKKMGLDVEEHIGGTGVIAVLQGKNPGKTVLLRAEMDALPITEHVNSEFKSVNEGVMHACGHDVHTASLVGAAKILSELKNEFAGTLVFMFQPGEEKGGGCKKMLDTGIIDKYKPEYAIALHVMPVKAGTILLSSGNITAYSDGFSIRVRGKSAHSSKPEDGIDAINISGNIIAALNSILAKEIDPRDAATFSIGTIKGGRSNNIVADYAEMRGMIRSASQEARDIIKKRLKEISEGIASMFGGSCDVEINKGYPSIINDERLTRIIRKAFIQNYSQMLASLDGNSHIDSPENSIVSHRPFLTADDFGFISEKIPSVYYMLGTGNFAPNHSPDFFVDESYIKLCTETMVLGVLELLQID